MKLAAIFTFSYAIVACAGVALFHVLDVMRGTPDPHRSAATLAWVALIVAAWLWTVTAIFRSGCR